jgi:hypothetical protein
MSAHKFPRHVENLIASLRGLPENHSTSRDREARSIADLVERIAKKRGIGYSRIEDVIRERWKEIVGEALACSCQPVRVERETKLVIAVSNPVVRRELLFHKRLIVEKIQAVPGCAKIKDAVFAQG